MNESSSSTPDHPNPVGAELSGRDRALRAAVMGVPSYIKRARRLEQTIEALHQSIDAERLRRLVTLLFRVGRLWKPERDPWIDALARECARHASWETARGAPVRFLLPWHRSGLRRQIRAFNERWRGFLERYSLDDLHRQQREFNRSYPIERELALPASPASSFSPIALFDREELFEKHPGLPES